MSIWSELIDVLQTVEFEGGVGGDKGDTSDTLFTNFSKIIIQIVSQNSVTSVTSVTDIMISPIGMDPSSESPSTKWRGSKIIETIGKARIGLKNLTYNMRRLVQLERLAMAGSP